jgi:hypothetical protein
VGALRRAGHEPGQRAAVPAEVLRSPAARRCR